MRTCGRQLHRGSPNTRRCTVCRGSAKGHVVPVPESALHRSGPPANARRRLAGPPSGATTRAALRGTCSAAWPCTQGHMTYYSPHTWHWEGTTHQQPASEDAESFKVGTPLVPARQPPRPPLHRLVATSRSLARCPEAPGPPPARPRPGAARSTAASRHRSVEERIWPHSRR